MAQPTIRPDAIGANGRPRALPALTSARWYAALTVFVVHALVFMPVYPFQKSELFRTIHSIIPMQVGSAAVTFFFLLSGFIIFWSNGAMKEPVYYVLRRLLKLYPTHLITAIMFLLVVWNFPWDRIGAWLPNFLLIHTWNPTWSQLGGLNVPSWSLCAELLFYVSFPLFLPLVRKIPTHRLLAAILVLFGIIVVLHLGYYLLADGYKGTHNTFVPKFFDIPGSPPYDIHAAPAWFLLPQHLVDAGYYLSYTFPLSRLPEFYLGVLGARAVLEGVWRNKNTAWPALALLASLALTWVLPVNFKMSVPMLLPVLALVCSLAVRDLEGRNGFFLTSKVALWGGNTSFALYLVQFPVMAGLQKWVIADGEYGFWGWLGFAVLALVISSVIADLIFRFVDDPAMKAYAKAHRARRTKRAAGVGRDAGAGAGAAHAADGATAAPAAPAAPADPAAAPAVPAARDEWPGAESGSGGVEPRPGRHRMAEES